MVFKTLSEIIKKCIQLFYLRRSPLADLHKSSENFFLIVEMTWFSCVWCDWPDGFVILFMKNSGQFVQEKSHVWSPAQMLLAWLYTVSNQKRLKKHFAKCLGWHRVSCPAQCSYLVKFIPSGLAEMYVGAWWVDRGQCQKACKFSQSCWSCTWAKPCCWKRLER